MFCEKVLANMVVKWSAHATTKIATMFVNSFGTHNHKEHCI